MPVCVPASVQPVGVRRTGRAAGTTAHAPPPPPWSNLGRSPRVGLTPAVIRGVSSDWRLGGGRAGSPSGSRSWSANDLGY